MKTYLVATVLFFIIDMIWLGLIAKNLYAQQIGFLLKKDINWAAAIIFYLLFVAGLTVFVINPAIEKNSVLFAFLMGGFFGLVTYATYDLTNLATVKNWPLLITFVDLAWGTTLGATVSSLTILVMRKIA